MNLSNDKNYWGFWATLAISLFIFITFTLLQTLGLIAYVFINHGDSIKTSLDSDSTAGLETLIRQHAFNGDAISMGQLPAAIIGIALVVFFISLRKPLTVVEYLELYKPRLKSLFFYIGMMIFAMIAMQVVNVWLDRETPKFMTEVYSSTTNLPLLWIAVGVAAPFFEEFLFRGFLLDGLKNSWIGTTGAVILTSASWAIIHMQYGWFEIATIFLLGVLFAISKLKTGSLYVPIVLHMIMNLTASVGMQLSQTQ